MKLIFERPWEKEYLLVNQLYFKSAKLIQFSRSKADFRYSIESNRVCLYLHFSQTS
jgi:hypothetical protein